MAWLERLHDLVAVAQRDIVDVRVAEYGGTIAMATGSMAVIKPGELSAA